MPCDMINRIVLPYVPWEPTPKQLRFLLAPEYEVLFGGAAGGAKSVALLMAGLQYVDVPGYAALIIRKSYADLAQPGGLMDRAQQWLKPTPAIYDGSNHCWTFPSGAKLKFGYLDATGDEYRHQGSEYQFIGLDEATQVAEPKIRYMYSRLRAAKAVPVPLRMRFATNPGGISHDYFKRRFIDHPEPGCLFIPSRLPDNPHLSEADYVKGLMHLDPILRRQLLEGDWTARHAGSLFKREWFPVVAASKVPSNIFARCRAWDLAASESETAKYTAGVLMCRDCSPEENFLILHVERFKRTPGARDKRIMDAAAADGKAVRVRVEQEPGSGGLAQAEAIQRWLTGYAVDLYKPSGDKFTRAGPLASMAEQGRVFIVEGAWNTAFLDELEAANPSEPDGDQTLDQMDAAVSAFEWCCTQRERTFATEWNRRAGISDSPYPDDNRAPDVMDGYRPLGDPMEGLR